MPFGTIEHYKTCLVTKGYFQVPSFNYHDTFSHVIKIMSIHVFLALVAIHNWEIIQMIVNTNFLHGHLHGKKKKKKNKKTLCNLLMNIKYVDFFVVCMALNKLPMLGMSTLIHIYIKLDFITQLEIVCLRLKPSWFYHSCFVCCMLMVCNNPSFLQHTKAELKSTSTMIDHGIVHHLLGIQIL